MRLTLSYNNVTENIRGKIYQNINAEILTSRPRKSVPQNRAKSPRQVRRIFKIVDVPIWLLTFPYEHTEEWVVGLGAHSLVYASRARNTPQSAASVIERWVYRPACAGHASKITRVLLDAVVFWLAHDSFTSDFDCAFDSTEPAAKYLSQELWCCRRSVDEIYECLVTLGVYLDTLSFVRNLLEHK